jgi:hypothetical protein
MAAAATSPQHVLLALKDADEQLIRGGFAGWPRWWPQWSVTRSPAGDWSWTTGGWNWLAAQPPEVARLLARKGMGERDPESVNSPIARLWSYWSDPQK